MSAPILTCAVAVDCAECGFTITVGDAMAFAADGWRHPTCLPEEDR